MIINIKHTNITQIIIDSQRIYKTKRIDIFFNFEPFLLMMLACHWFDRKDSLVYSLHLTTINSDFNFNYSLSSSPPPLFLIAS